MSYSILHAGPSRSFPDQHPFVIRASANGDGLVIVGEQAGAAFAQLGAGADRPFLAIELRDECLGVHTGERSGSEPSNVLGFARFRLGSAAPSDLVELVRQPGTSPSALQAAREAFESVGLKVAVCGDFPGRIVNRLLRPYYNAALRRLDEGLATAADMDLTLKLGLGYPEGPISLLERTGLADHHDVSLALFEALGQSDYVPARCAQVARQRQRQGAD
jgi:3-hydroxybutyryl-CoA dehydrogenase